MLEMRGICKSYGAVRANRNIDLTVTGRRIVGLLGENGSGKSTLMKVLFGMTRADAGSITFRGRTLAGHSPRDAIAAGIGMIHQHFTLVDAMTVADNVMLGWVRAGAWLRSAEIAEMVRQASATYGLGLDPHALVSDLPLGLRQRVEIVKAILHGADLFVLDEPTSILSPPEVAGLLAVLRRLREEGHSIIFISHKLGEVLELCDEVVVLRDGEVAGRCEVAGATRADLARMMVGRDIAESPYRAAREAGPECLVVDRLSASDASGTERLHDVSFSICAGEIFAIAGVDGNGQAELVDVIAGLTRPTQGRVALDGTDITAWPVSTRLAAGMAYIPVDRSGVSLVLDMTIEDNIALRDFDRAPFSHGAWLDTAAIRKIALARITGFDIRAAGPDVPLHNLSGGNQQKVVVAREIGRKPRVLLAFQPTWGLDPGAARYVIDQVLALKDAGGAVLYISSELEEVLLLGDRVGVMFNGRLVGDVQRDDVDVTQIGLMMAGAAEQPSQASIERAS